MATATIPSAARAAQWFHALSDDTRVEIIAMLSHGERCVCELQSSLAAAQSRLSFHLKTLKDAGLVTDRRDGRWVHYSVNREALAEMSAFLHAVKPGKHLGSCDASCC